MSDQPPPPMPPPPGQTTIPPQYANYGKAPVRASQFGKVSSFGRRLGGFVLDGLIYGVISLFFAIPGIALIIAAFADLGDCVETRSGRTVCEGDVSVGLLLVGLALLLLMLIPYAFYIWQLSKTGQTFGRKIVGIKVIDEATGQPPGFGRALGRTLFAAFISGQIVYIGYLWMLWDDQQQTLHDKVARTHVIDV